MNETYVSVKRHGEIMNVDIRSERGTGEHSGCASCVELFDIFRDFADRANFSFLHCFFWLFFTFNLAELLCHSLFFQRLLAVGLLLRCGARHIYDTTLKTLVLSSPIYFVMLRNEQLFGNFPHKSKIITKMYKQL